MALIQCRECGKQISDSASFCPHCGFSNKKNQSNLPVVLFVSIIILAFYWYDDTKYARNISQGNCASAYSLGEYVGEECDELVYSAQKNVEEKDVVYGGLMIFLFICLIVFNIGAAVGQENQNDKKSQNFPEKVPTSSSEKAHMKNHNAMNLPNKPEKQIENQWTDENGNSWRKYDDGSIEWFNGTHWQTIDH